jgi:DNA-binding response OmpR family regulator
MVGLPERTRPPRPPRLVVVGGGKREYVAALQAAGYKVAGVASMRKALALRPRPDGLILELLLPDARLSRLTSALRPRGARRAMTLVALAGADREPAVVKAGAAFCHYPCPPEELVRIVRRAVALPELLGGGR